jgi:lipopolysaccharide transport system ATP-binding protein
MYVRLAFAVAAHLDCDILIADEVLAVGDDEFQKKALGKMQDLSTGQGKTVLFVSHNMGTVKNLCESSILLNEGKIIASGETSDVIASYTAKKNNTKIIRSKEELPIYINSVTTYDDNDMEKNVFNFSGNIHLRFGITIKKYDPFYRIGVRLLSKDETAIFTDFIYLRDFCANGPKEIVIDYIIKGSFIAPSNYSFLLAIDNKTESITVDCLSNICPIKIIDDGTKFAIFEGSHYGFFIVQDECEWKRIK